ncbi:unnamed protein product [Oppiella nova]|uniref:Uncharacterized protein n=1 Tax=Oppiella nova TaxID=334625 RepID=A0A7R9L9W6_9ACAR|nr:unnamed protein product [Oppiella nova]CAG2161361.1 unnamed protein product [Oppiella nova]
MSSSAEGNKNLNHNQQQPPKHHQLLHQLPAHPQPSYPLVLPNNSFAVNQNAQRLRNEIIASAATLPSLHNSTGGSKSPLKRFWEFKLNDPDSDCAIGHTNSKIKSKTFCWCLAAVVMCLAIVVIGVSAFTYFMGMSAPLPVYDESNAGAGVVVKCRISLNIVLLTAAQEVGLTFINALERRHGRLPAGNLRVDITTIKFTDMRSGSAIGAKLTDDNLVHENSVQKHNVLDLYRNNSLSPVPTLSLHYYDCHQTYQWSGAQRHHYDYSTVISDISAPTYSMGSLASMAYIRGKRNVIGGTVAAAGAVVGANDTVTTVLDDGITDNKYSARDFANTKGMSSNASAPAPNASAPEVAGSPAPSPPLMPNGYRPVMANTGNGLATDSPIASVVKGSHDGRDGKPDSAITTGKYIST